MAEDERTDGLLSREHWAQFAGVAAIVGIAMFGGVAWIINTVNAGSAAALAAINAQAVLVAKSQAETDHRVTTLEAEQIEEARATDRLTTEIEQLRATEADLTTAVQRLKDLMPLGQGWVAPRAPADQVRGPGARRR